MDKPLNVVVLVGSESVPEQVFRSAFGDVPPANVFSRVSGRAVTVSLVAQLPAAPELELASSHVLAPRRTPLLDRLLAKLPVARPFICAEISRRNGPTVTMAKKP